MRKRKFIYPNKFSSMNSKKEDESLISKELELELELDVSEVNLDINKSEKDSGNIDEIL